MNRNAGRGPSESVAGAIVAGVDGSDQGMCAAIWAAREAERRKLPLHLITAYTVPVFAASSLDAGYATVDDSVIREGAEAVLKQAVVKASTYDVDLHARIETGDAAGVLLELSEEAAMMVVGSRGRGGFVGRLLGSVSSALPAHAKCPTVVVPLCAASRLPDADVSDENSPEAPEQSQVRPVVTVGVDGSEHARMASLEAAELATRRGLPLEVLCTLPPFTGSLAWVPAPLDREALHEDLLVQLEAGKQWLNSHFPNLEITLKLLDGPPVELLIEESRTVEILVLGTRGRGGFAGMLLGSTSQGVLHHAKGPVMIVPDKEDPRLADREKFGPMFTGDFGG